MKLSYIAALLLMSPLLVAEEQATSEAKKALPDQASAPHAWLGLRVAKPDPTIAAQVPALPPGIGFLVKFIDGGGPAESAGLQEHDLVWKFGDQMLVNESQLATLLRLSKPGQEITLAAFRGGKPLEVKLKLGETPPLKRPFSSEMVEASILPTDFTSPMRVVNVAEKTATYSTDDGRAQVQRDGDTDKVRIQNHANELIFEGSFTQDASLDKVPEDWRRRICALRRGLDQSLNGGMAPPRQPRPRVVPPVTGNP